jgi:hypothetical protein
MDTIFETGLEWIIVLQEVGWISPSRKTSCRFFRAAAAGAGLPF